MTWDSELEFLGERGIEESNRTALSNGNTIGDTYPI